MSQTQLSNLEALVPLLRDVLLSNPQLGPEARDQWLALEPALQRSLAPQAPIPTVSSDASAAAPGPVSPLTLPLPDPTPDEYDLNPDFDLEAGLGSKESSEHSFQSQHDSHAGSATDPPPRWTSITLPVPTVQYLARLASLGWASLSETSRLATLQLFARPTGDPASDSGAGEELHLEQVSAFFTRIADRRQRRLERRRRVRAVLRSVGEWTAALALLLLLFFFAFISIWLAAAARGDVEKAFAGVMSSFWLLVLLYAAGRIALKGPMRFARGARLDEEQGVSYNADGVTRAQEGLLVSIPTFPLLPITTPSLLLLPRSTEALGFAQRATTAPTATPTTPIAKPSTPRTSALAPTIAAPDLLALALALAAEVLEAEALALELALWLADVSDATTELAAEVMAAAPDEPADDADASTLEASEAREDASIEVVPVAEARVAVTLPEVTDTAPHRACWSCTAACWSEVEQLLWVSGEPLSIDV